MSRPEFQIPAAGVKEDDRFMLAGQIYRVSNVEHIAPYNRIRLTAWSSVDPVEITLELPGARYMLLF